MILAVDAQYNGDGVTTGKVAGVLCEGWDFPDIIETHVFHVTDVAPYEPGSFYKRELPCLKAVLTRLKGNLPDIIIVDGYVDTSPGHPGLGRRLFDELEGKVVVIGVAKTAFYGAEHVEVLRGTSQRPLYVTAAGMDVSEAAERVRAMQGKYRIPEMLKTVDSLARELDRP